MYASRAVHTEGRHNATGVWYAASVRHTGRYICSHIAGCFARMANVIEIRVTSSVFIKDMHIRNWCKSSIVFGANENNNCCKSHRV